MSQYFEARISHIRDAVVLMSSLVERQLAVAARALQQRDEQLADEVETLDAEVDRMEITLDEMVITYMATHAPVATDCRMMVAVSKISSNLERIGDQATSIARRARSLCREPVLNAPTDIDAMADFASSMLHDAVSCFLESNAELALQVIERDVQIDELNRELAKELTNCMIKDAGTITRGLALMLVGKSLERIADHAQNIAEEVYYLCKAHDIRHRGFADMKIGAA